MKLIMLKKGSRLISKYQRGNPVLVYNEALDWAEKYFNSEGFKQRFLNTFNSVPYYQSKWYYPKDFLNSSYAGTDVKLVKRNPTLRVSGLKLDPYTSNGVYNRGNLFVRVNPNYKFGSSSVIKSWWDIIPHELGHAIDNSIDIYGGEDGKVKSPTLFYSDLFPILHNSKSGVQYRKKFKKGIEESSNWDMMFNDPETQDVELVHNGQPQENYGDLIEFRMALHKNGIFNSFTTDTFTKKHLDAAKKKFGHLRLFKNYDDLDIIWMMNHIAQNEQDTQDNEINYT